MSLSRHKIFISHRPEDRNIAFAVRDALRLLSNGKLELFVCADIPGGREWRDSIDEKIGESDIMLFLYTGEGFDYSWCLYEIGLFSRPNDPNPRPIICIKSPFIESLPYTLDKYKVYEAAENGILRFLKDLLYKGKFTNKDRLNEEFFTLNNFDLVIQNLMNAFGSVTHREIILGVGGRQLNIYLIGSDEDRTEIEIDDAFIAGDTITMDILGVYDHRVQFKKLYETFKNKNNAKWLEQLKSSIMELRNGNQPSSYLPPFSTRDGRKFQPILSQFERIHAMQTDIPAVINSVHLLLNPIPPEDSLLPESLKDESSIIVKPMFPPVKEKTDSKLVFILMPYKEEKNLQEVYYNFTKPIVESFGLNCRRADDIFKHQMIMEDIWEHICTTRFVISDLTDKNTNVFYELGMAHTVGKRVILITQNDEDVPFDLRHLRYIKYEFTPPGMEKFKDELKKSIGSVLQEN